MRTTDSWSVENLSQEKRRREVAQPPSAGTVVAQALVPQMGSDNIHLVKQVIDQRKFAVLSEPTQAALGYFEYRAKVDKIRFWDHVVSWELNTTPSIGGLGRRQVIQTIQAASGGRPVEVADKPNVLARNITNRNWKENAAREGKMIVE